MPEPLKGQIVWWLKSTGHLVDPSGRIVEEARKGVESREMFYAKDVKSAIQGLLEEIEKTDLLVLEELGFVDKDNIDDLEEIVINALDYVKCLIKKWLPDVVVEDEI